MSRRWRELEANEPKDTVAAARYWGEVSVRYAHKARRLNMWAISLGVLGGLLVAVVLSGVIRAGQGPAPSVGGPRPSGAVSAAESGPSGPVGFLSGDGESLVPDQVAPGMYLSAGPVGSVSCYAEAVGPNGQHLDQKVQKGQTVLVVPEGAVSVVAHFCQPFSRVR